MRARNLKPGFFKNEDLAELPFEARILFAGLWCLADREGRLEDRPKRIKIEVFPYDDVDIEKLLEQLGAARVILRYVDEGAEKGYISIPTFKRHQNPHKNEKPSEIPAPGDIAKLRDDSGTSTVPLGLNPSSLNPESREHAREEASCGKPKSPAPTAGATKWVALYVDAREQAGNPASRRECEIFGAKIKEVGQVDEGILADTIERMIERNKGPTLLPHIYGDVKRESEHEIFAMQTGGGRRVR